MRTFKKISGWKRGQPFTAAQRLETFYLRIEKMPTGCWEWRGALDRKGYGNWTWRDVSSSPRRAHRCAWELLRGPIPGGLHVLHRCDNPPCCNPDHLFLGTISDNAKDSVAKGRWGERKRRLGEANNKAKLTKESVLRIRFLAAQGQSYTSIAKLFGVTDVQVSNIARRKQWKHI